MTEDRRIKWERTLEWPLTLAAVLFLVAYAVPILRPDVDPSLPDLIVTLTWAAFGVDYIVRLVLSGARWRFVRQHPLDLLVIALPILRPLRLLRLVALLSVLNRYASAGALRGRVVLYIVGSTALLILVSSLAILDAERGREGANIEDYGDAAWWAITTMTTVGYGDRFPVTGAGRLIAAALMLAGIALLGTVTATLASYLLERVQEAEEEAQAATRQDVRALTEEVAALRRDLQSGTSRP
jgi:voltage-gated potassium channel